MIPQNNQNMWQNMGYNMRTRQTNQRSQAVDLQTNMTTSVNNRSQVGPNGYPMSSFQQQQDLQRQQMAAAMTYNHIYRGYQQPAAIVPQFPPHPDVTFRRLPFYDHIADLVQPSSLIPTSTNRNQEVPFVFHLTAAQATQIASHRDVRPAAKIDYVYQVQMRFCMLDTTSAQEDCFPAGVVVKVNNKVATLPSPIPTNKQGQEPKRPPRPVNITQLVKLSPTVTNTMSVGWAADYGKGYVVRVSLVHKLTAQELLQRLKTKGIKHADFTTGLIKEKLNEEADCEISTTSLHVSLLCPLGKFRMSVPCRATTCNHLQCFDALVYLEMNEKRATWMCPVCDKPALYDDLVIDGYFQDCIASPRLPSGVNEIELHKDGSWQVQIQKDEPKRSTKENLFDSVEIISDDLEVVMPVASTSVADSTTHVGTNGDSAAAAPPKAVTVDLTLSDSEESEDDDDAPLKRKADELNEQHTAKKRANMLNSYLI